MDLIFNSPSWILSSILIVAPAILISLFLVWIIRKKISHEKLRKNHDVAGFTFGIIGVLYSVILGFTVISVQERYNNAEETMHIEATMLGNLYRDADFFPAVNQSAIRTSLRQYTNYVIKEEWFLPKTKNRRIRAENYLHQIWNSYTSIDLTTDKIKIWYEESIKKLDKFMNARLDREFSSWEHLGSMMWSLLISGALITICFMFFFGLENVLTQMVMTALLAGYLSFILYLVFSLDHVFNGPNRIKPVALEQTLLLFDQWDQQKELFRK